MYILDICSRVAQSQCKFQRLSLAGCQEDGMHELGMAWRLLMMLDESVEDMTDDGIL